MTDWKTIRIPADDFERHRERKGPGQTWADYIDGEAPTYSVVELPGEDRTTEEILEDMREATERFKNPPDYPVVDSGFDYDRLREIVRQEVQDALQEVTR